SGPASANRRVPWPMITGNVSRLISSTSSFSSSQRTRAPLPCACSSPPGSAFSSLPAAPSPGDDGRVRPARLGERGGGHVLAPRVQRLSHRALARILHEAPGAGEDLVRPPSEQERVSARVDVVGERGDLLVHQREGPSA